MFVYFRSSQNNGLPVLCCSLPCLTFTCSFQSINRESISEYIKVNRLIFLQLAKNKQLSRYFTRNLNTDPDGWDLKSDSFDAVVCCVSCQYMQQPERVFAEIYRVLKPSGVCIMAFSNRLYSTKGDLSLRNLPLQPHTTLHHQFSPIPFFPPYAVFSIVSHYPRAFVCCHSIHSTEKVVVQTPLLGLQTSVRYLLRNWEQLQVA